MDEFELTFNGTPSEFGVMAKEFDQDFVIGGARYPTPSSSPFAIGLLRPDANPVNAILYQSKGDGAGSFQSVERLRITAQKAPGGKSKLRIRINTGSIEGFDEYPEAIERWERLKAEMGRQGWIDLSREGRTEEQTLSEVHVCVTFERQFVGKPADIESRLDFFNREKLSAVLGPFVRVWVVDRQADPLETRLTLMGKARDGSPEGKFGDHFVGEVVVLAHGNWVKGEAYDARANDYFEKLGKWLVDGVLPIAEDQQTIGTTLELENRRLPMNEIDKWQAEATEYLQQSWRVDLKQFASGTWPGSLDAFRSALMAFGLRAKDDEFGKHSIRFWILPNTTHPISGETCWMVGMSGCNRKSLYTVKNEEGYLEAEGGEPYAEVRAREIAQGYRVDLYVQRDVHEVTVGEYLDKLYQALQRDGLQTDDIAHAGQHSVGEHTLDELDKHPRDSKLGPTLKIRERFEVFKKLKDAHPTWSQDRVAREAGDQLGEILTGEAVRNAYRAMGEKWERADRVR